MTINLEPHNPQWKAEFDRLKTILKKELHGFDVTIHHVGSTAIPGLLAKPVLDIDIVLKDKNSMKEVSARLLSLGYISTGEQGVPGRFAFRQTSGSTPRTVSDRKWMDHHLYVCYEDSLAYRNHISFRDALFNDQALVKEYAQLKKHLAAEVGITREKYTERKTAFIIAVLTSAGLIEAEIDEIIRVNIK